MRSAHISLATSEQLSSKVPSKIVSSLPSWRGEAEFLGPLYESTLLPCNFQSDHMAFSLDGIAACQTVIHTQSYG